MRCFATAGRILSLALIVACSGDDGGTDGNDNGDDDADGSAPDAASIACDSLIPRQFGSGGCRLVLVSPANCEAVDFSRLGYVEFAWSTETTFCEGPHKFFLAGHPSATWEADNGFLIDLASTDGSFVALGDRGSQYAMTRNIGGVVRLVEADLEGITTTTGQYHWTVAGFFALENGGSVAGSGTFTVR